MPCYCVRSTEIYVNSAAEDGEIYANENIELQPRVASERPQVRTVDKEEDGEDEEEYQNTEEISRTASQRPASRDDEAEDNDAQQIYENVIRRPTPTPKPRHPF